MKLASAKNGLIYPVEEERRALGQDGDTTQKSSPPPRGRCEVTGGS